MYRARITKYFQPLIFRPALAYTAQKFCKKYFSQVFRFLYTRPKRKKIGENLLDRSEDLCVIICAVHIRLMREEITIKKKVKKQCEEQPNT